MLAAASPSWMLFFSDHKDGDGQSCTPRMPYNWDVQEKSFYVADSLQQSDHYLESYYCKRSFVIHRTLLLLIAASAVTTSVAPQPSHCTKTGPSPSSNPDRLDSSTNTLEITRRKRFKQYSFISLDVCVRLDQDVSSSSLTTTTTLSQSSPNWYKLSRERPKTSMRSETPYHTDRVSSTRNPSQNSISFQQSPRQLSTTISLLSIPMNRDNVIVASIFVGLSCFGLLHLLKLIVQVRKKCLCKLCRGDYVILEPLGHGGFGNVFLAKKRRGLISLESYNFDKKWQTTKKIDFHNSARHQTKTEHSEKEQQYLNALCKQNRLIVLKKVNVLDVTDADSVALEGRRLIALKHSNMVSYLDDFLHQEFELGRGVITESLRCYCVIVMEFCPGGDLRQLIEKNWDDLRESQVRTWIYATAKALSAVHEKGIIHRDIKSANIFLLYDKSVKLGDFGLSRVISAHGTKITKGSKLRYQLKDDNQHQWHSQQLIDNRKFSNELTIAERRYSYVINHRHWVPETVDDFDEFGMSQAGTDCYMAPEVHKNQDYGKPCDVWGLGCVLLELISGIFMWEFETGDDQLPFGLAATENPEFVPDVIKETVSPIVSQKLKRLLLRMLHPDSARRATVSEILRKKWLMHHRDLFPKSKGKKGRDHEMSFGNGRKLKDGDQGRSNSHLNRDDDFSSKASDACNDQNASIDQIDQERLKVSRSTDGVSEMSLGFL